ncbi:MAG: 2-phospho-L-lactate transferase [Burkholderiales bacterium]
MFLALAGGVGGAKLAEGLAAVLTPEALAIVVNTGDDFEHLGVHVSPDVDTVMYTLAGLANRTTGWGRADETWNFMAALEVLGGPTWFRLGDKDLATSTYRADRLRGGATLSAVTRELSERLGVRHRVIPMSDDAVRTFVHTDQGRLAFQDYFVRRQCGPRLSRVEFHGVEAAAPSPAFAGMLSSNELEALILCPSNPYLSIAPLLTIPAVDRWWTTRRVPVIAVSPIVGGRAIKGPAAKIMTELGVEVSALGVARHYAGRVDAWVIDRADALAAKEIEALGKRMLVTDTVMKSPDDAVRLAAETIAFAKIVTTPAQRPSPA